MDFVAREKYIFRKRVLLVCSTLICSWLYICISLTISRKNLLTDLPANQITSLPYHNISTKEMNYVLIWTSNYTYPFKLLESGQKAFIEAGCEVTECYVTSDKNYLKNLSDFHAVLFHGPEKWSVPSERSPKQKYVFASVESAQNYPVCDREAEGFFNWTWTYKLDSHVPWNAITVRNLRGDQVGPRKEMTWIDEMQPVDEAIKKTFAKRRKAAAWFVSNCHSKSGRGEYVKILNRKLRAYGLRVDIFGDCGLWTCPRKNQTKKDCDRMLRKDYYFYLAFENSSSDDYVTEKVLHGYRNHVVPVVFGSANYTRFLPPNSYLDTNLLNESALAQVMHTAIQTPRIYHEFFRWTNHYTVEDSEMRPDSHPACRLCAALHDQRQTDRITVCNNLLRWWNGKNKNICKTHYGKKVPTNTSRKPSRYHLMPKETM